jgi:formylglycine-generating enzyme required for sulfatase activity
MKVLALTLGVGLLAVSGLTAQNRDLVPAPQPLQGRRLALVIGNDSYLRSPLLNARNDSRAIAQALRGLQFDVTALENGTRSGISSAILAFGRRVNEGDLALVFYAGHGVQVEGVNFLIPVDFKGYTEDDVRVDAISSDEFTRAIRRARVGVLVLDACRDNPFSGTRAVGRGLAPIQARGLLVAFSAGAGQTASDGPEASNGIFTGELIRILGSSGMGLREMFYEVQRRVQARTQGKQFPEVYSQLVDDVVLTEKSAAVADLDELSRREELLLWESIKDSRSVAVFDDYLRQYPRGRFRLAAVDRLDSLRAAVAPAPAPVSPPKPVVPPAAPPAAPPKPAANTAAKNAAATPPATRAADPAPAPRSVDPIDTMKWRPITPGAFQMGCVPGDTQCSADERRHLVNVPRAFSMTTTEITVSMYRAFAMATASNVPEQPLWNTRPDHPVVNVTWGNASSFCAWAGGRLPTEAEWEYAARGGAAGWTYVWSRENQAPPGNPLANIADQTLKDLQPAWPAVADYKDGYAYTAPVGQFPPNTFELFDMGGNVLEWVQDWFSPFDETAMNDPKGPPQGTLRVLRGGSWFSDPRFVRTSNRSRLDPDTRDDYIGFRCAKDR